MRTAWWQGARSRAVAAGGQEHDDPRNSDGGYSRLHYHGNSLIFGRDE